MIKEINNIFLKSDLFKFKYVYIYSDFRYFFKKEKFSKKKIRNFLNLFLKRGITCIVPSFSYTTSGIFNIKKTKSKIGFLANYILENEKFERSSHPIFSFVAIGKNKNLMKKLGKSAFGKNCLHSKLIDKNCCFLNFNRPLINGNTLIHHIEQKNKANYRFEKTFNTKVYKNDSFIDSKFKAFVRKNLNDKFTEGTFKKVYNKIKNKKFFYKRNVGKLEILVYPYDIFYNELDYLYKKDPNIFIKGKS